jgi:hypothetical protein
MTKGNYILLVPFCFCAYLASAQTTISNSTKEPVLSNEPARKATAHKVLIVPFESRMYMSQIDHKINEETKWSQQKIRENLRFGLDEELYKSLKKKMQVMSFLDDTVKYKKDLNTTYSKLGYKFVKVPNQAKYAAPKNEKDPNYVQKGQLAAETDTENKFMNAEVHDKTLLPGFNTKYKTDLFLFINQLDIVSEVATVGLTTKSSRTLTVHYTVFTMDGKEINSGISKTDLPGDVNNPSKIASKYFSKIADEIAARIEKAVAPVPVK